MNFFSVIHVSSRRVKGFTLLELSIVLVIIGLIIGGIMVGQNMIKSASIRSTVGQYEKFNAAINTFKNKYTELPGDITGAKAARFGMTSRNGDPGHGDGNGRIEGCSADAIAPGCENLLFWRDLSDAQLVAGSFVYATDNIGFTFPPPYAEDFFPASKLGKGILFTVFTADGKNYYQLGGIGGISGAQYYSLYNGISPLDAYNIDLKIDDGAPLTGIAQAVDGSRMPNVTVTPAAPAAGVCVTTDTGNPYNTTTKNYAGTAACQLRLDFQ